MYLLDNQWHVPGVWEAVSCLEWKKWLSGFDEIQRFTLKRTVTQSLQMGGPREIWDGADDWGWTRLGLVYHGEDGLMFCLKMISRKHSNISLSPWLPTSVLSFQRGYSYWSFISHHKKTYITGKRGQERGIFIVNRMKPSLTVEFLLQFGNSQTFICDDFIRTF